jgi:hypothetical protein
LRDQPEDREKEATMTEKDSAIPDANNPGPLNNVIRIDDERIKGHLDRVVRGTVEETLNAFLDAEADRLCNAERYERTEARRDTRAGHYERQLETKPAAAAHKTLPRITPLRGSCGLRATRWRQELRRRRSP